MNNNIIIFGSSGHAQVIATIIQRQKKYNILGFLDDFKPIGTRVLGYTVLGKIEDIVNFKCSICGGIIGIGDNWARSEIFNKIINLIPHFLFISAIDPSAIIASNVEIGIGTTIMPGVIVNNNSKIGNFCILNTKASLDHDGILEDFSSLAPGVTTGGGVKIGYCTAICLGANIIHGITIGSQSIVGSGALVVKNVHSNSVSYGIPAKHIRNRIIGESYL